MVVAFLVVGAMVLFGKTFVGAGAGAGADLVACRFGLSTAVALSPRSIPSPRFIKLAGVIGVTPLTLPEPGTGGGGMSWFKSTGLGVDVVETVRAE